MGIIGDAWRNIWEIQKLHEIQRKRELLDREVQKRKQEAIDNKISDILIMIKEEGNLRVKPFVSDYKQDSSEPRTTVLSFYLNGNAYRIIFQKDKALYDHSGNSKYDREPVGVMLQSNGQTLYSARIYWVVSYDYLASWYVTGDSLHDIEAYVPGDWVRDFKRLVKRVENAKEREEFDAKHSRSVLNDLRKKFGL